MSLAAVLYCTLCDTAAGVETLPFNYIFSTKATNARWFSTTTTIQNRRITRKSHKLQMICWMTTFPNVGINSTIISCNTRLNASGLREENSTMVAISRKGSDYDPLPLCRTPNTGNRRTSFSFGMASPRSGSNSFSSYNEKSWSSSSSYNRKRRQVRAQSRSNLLIKSIYGMSVLSWVAIRIFSQDYTAVISTINNEVRVIKAQMLPLIEELKAVDSRIKDEKQHVKNLQKTRSALDHEIQFYTKVESTTGRRVDPAPRSGNEKLIKNWLSHRTDGMLSKIYKLQRHLQESSKKILIER